MRSNAALKLPTPEDLVGTVRRFGPYGPAYEIVEVVRDLDDGDTLLKLRVVENEEVVEEKYSIVLKDPEE